MSEAMSSVEIEDVLSSIRRLVSEDLRPPSKAVPAPKPDDKLLLTPAFRVVASDPSADVPPRAAALPRLHLGLAPPPKEELVATLQRAVEAQDIEWESEVGDPLPQVARMEWTEAGWAAMGALDGVAPLAEVDPWEQADPDQDNAVAAEAQPALPEDVWVDEVWADQAEAEAVAELQDPEPAAGPTDKPSQSASSRAAPRPDEDLTFDDQVLRDLVRDLLREELQGDLGERITRNVRKLVRAEISRMIASQDLD